MQNTGKLRRVVSKAIAKLAQFPRILAYRLISTAAVEGRPVLRQPLHATGLGRIRFQGKVSIGLFPSAYFFSTYSYVEARYGAARVSFGDGTAINNGFVAVAEYSAISIGERVLVGTNVEIYDSDFHGITVAERGFSRPENARPVTIESDVFIGSNVRIMKGVRIGTGTVIASGSVVVKDIPPGVVAGGNPARVIRHIVSDE